MDEVAGAHLVADELDEFTVLDLNVPGPIDLFAVAAAQGYEQGCIGIRRRIPEGCLRRRLAIEVDGRSRQQ
jgi:hypothetical protein